MSVVGLNKPLFEGVSPEAVDPIIEVRGLSKIFGMKTRAVTAVENVSFSVGHGEFVSLLGPSGSGKSTILNMIAALMNPSGGRIAIDGRPVEYGEPHPTVGYVSQKDTSFPWRTVARNIEYGLEVKGVPAEERRDRVAAAIRQAGLAGFEGAYPLQLSGGMRQRVSLMRTLITRPKILLMDEAFGALDTHTKIEMHRILMDDWEAHKQTVLFVTHDLAEALTLSDRILLLSARPGRLKEVFQVTLPRPRDPVLIRETQEYAKVFSRIWHSLGEEFQKGWSE
jgi:NitT/TauT family transport system ATP-binding protein